MEGDMVEQDYDEFEMLLGEIPCATSGNHFSRQGSFTAHSRELHKNSTGKAREFSSCNLAANLPSPSRKDSEPYNFPRPPTTRGCASFNGNVAFSKSPEHQKLHRTINCGYENCLTLLLDEMSINENLTSKPSSPASVMNMESPLNHIFLQSGQIVSRQNNTLLGFDATDMSIPPSASIELEKQSPALKRNELVNPCDRIDAECNVNLFKSGNVYEPNQIPESLLGNSTENQQVCPMNTMAMPMNPCFNTYQLLPTAHGVHLPKLYQPNYFVDTQSPPMHLAQPGMFRHSREEESFGRLYQHYLYAQNLQSQRPEIRQVKRSMNFGMGPFNGNNFHQCSGLSIPQHLEHCNQNLHLNDPTIYNNSSLLDYRQYLCQQSTGRLENFWPTNGEKVVSISSLSCSVKDSLGHQSFEVRKQSFPEMFLTRSHGVNSMGVLRPNLVTPDQRFLLDENRLRWSNGDAHLSYGLNNRSLQFDDQSYEGSCLDVFYSGLASKSMQRNFNSVDEISGRIVLMAKDQHGCRFLQRKFAEGSQEDIDNIFSKIIFHIVDLMTDPFGNYLIQKLLEVCNEEKIMFILKVITRNNDELNRISCDMHGTRVVQKIIETVQTPEQISMIVSSLAPNIISVMKHINGNHVAQRCLQYLSKFSMLLIDAAIAHCVELATDRQGCCVLQKCLIHSDDEQKKRLLDEISSYSLILSKDQYGNYVVQYVLDLKDPWATAVVLEQFLGNYDHLSVQKYSSNVVEKCLKLAEKDDFAKIIQELMGSDLLSQILQDPYGNYVMQTALIESKVHEDLHTDLVEAIIALAPTLRSSPYGKKVLSTACLSVKK
ncbi:pumilio homolog 12-like [Phalaenopsis equestris]|uniref:pumilio homolog 12-like n=1 Tax=Phalaenopsis equestris TaxID=78828 RepID=UPI0009E2A446|nr:pumilio homolog 12-like [Phalaenopsis equestris]XP_020588924.1 pumilio homolog 12-like [Phalaenopsis equestris]